MHWCFLISTLVWAHILIFINPLVQLLLQSYILPVIDINSSLNNQTFTESHSVTVLLKYTNTKNQLHSVQSSHHTVVFPQSSHNSSTLNYSPILNQYPATSKIQLYSSTNSTESTHCQKVQDYSCQMPHLCIPTQTLRKESQR